MSDPEYMRLQAAKCRRLATGLPSHEPAREALFSMADELELKAMSLNPPAPKREPDDPQR